MKTMNELLVATVVDARGLSCPMPIVKTALSVKALTPGDVVEVLATDPGSQRDVLAWCRSTGNDLIEQAVDGPVYRFLIRRK